MSSLNVSDYRHKGAALASRVLAAAIPKALTPVVKDFLAAQKAYEAAAVAVDTAQDVRDSALADVAAADAVLDASVDTLVDLLPGAGLGTRQQPLKGFSSKSPSEVKKMPYAEEPDEVDSAVKKILAKKPPADVVKACKAASANGAVVRKKLAIFPGKQAAYTKAITARDALLPGLLKATASLKNHALVVWEDDPATFKSVFAAPTRVEAPVEKRAKKKTAAPAAPAAAPKVPS
jgi:hypothetical protein